MGLVRLTMTIALARCIAWPIEKIINSQVRRKLISVPRMKRLPTGQTRPSALPAINQRRLMRDLNAIGRIGIGNRGACDASGISPSKNCAAGKY